MPAVQYEVQIIKTGTGGAQAAAELKQVQDNARAAGAELAKMAGYSGGSDAALNKISISAGSLKTAARALSSDLKLLALVSFPEVAGKGLAAEVALKGISSTAKLLHVSVIGVAGSLALLTPSIIAGTQAWGAYKDRMKEVESAGSAFAAQMNALGSAVDVLSRLKKEGVLSEDQAADFTARLAPQKTESSAQFRARIFQMEGDLTKSLDEVEAAAKAGPAKIESDEEYAARIRTAQMQLIDAQSKNDAAKRSMSNWTGAQNTLSDFQGVGASGEEAAVRQVSKAYDEAKAKLVEYGKQGVSVGDMLIQLDQEYAGQIDAIHQKKLDGIQEEDNKQAQQVAEQIKQEQELAQQIGEFRSRVREQGLQGYDLQKQKLTETYQQEIAYVQKLSLEEQISGQQEINMLQEIEDAHARLKQRMIEDELGIQSWRQVGVSATQQFSQALSGLAVNGFKDAGQAAADFAKQIAQLILQMVILRAISGAFGGGSSINDQVGSGALSYANGGVRFAANGIMTVSRPTFLPQFNVIAGESNPEMLTVLNNPKMMSIGGIQAAVGNAAGNKLAITGAEDLARAANGGHIIIEIQHSESAEARLVSNAVQGSVVTINKMSKRNTDFARNIKGLVQ